jgi:GMP synthase-like glutamine amidotransferase
VRVLVVRHHEEDSAGFIGDAFAGRGAALTVHRHPDDGPLPDAAPFDHVVVLGASWSANDPEPWIAEEVAWLRTVQRPVLGICFGAQLLSAACGGSVEKAPVKEIGWVRVDPVPGARPAIDAGPWLQFHGDRCVLGPDASVLARNELCVQAFTVGPHLAVQFHPEVDAAQLRAWIEHGGLAEVEEAGQDVDTLLRETKEQEPAARRRAEALVAAFVARASSLTA